MAKADEKTAEEVKLFYPEMDLVFKGLDLLKADAEKVYSSADKIGISKASVGAQEYVNKIEDLKQKFLHS